MAVAGPAAVFARKYRQQLFPDTPLLFAAVDRAISRRRAAWGERDRRPAVVNDFRDIVDEILQLLPQTRQVFMVMGSGRIGSSGVASSRSSSRRFTTALTFVWSDDLSLPEILRRAQACRTIRRSLCRVRHGRGGSGVCGRAGARRPPRHGQCPSVWRAQRHTSAPALSADP